jgi:2',3'-cyclic-nucleotide 2'-phosphodiesterase (5'-nucleotidase family)
VNKIVLFLVCISFLACKTSKVAQTKSDDGILKFTLFQINDVYEISPLENGKTGGLARVAHLVKTEKQTNPNTYFILAGDFLSPSLLGTMKLDGRKVAGRQMIEVLNEAGLDLATFGNHEFDLGYEELQDRLDESRFSYVSSNVYRVFSEDTTAFYKRVNSARAYFPKLFVQNLRDQDGTQATVGFFGITLPFTRKRYIHYKDPITSALKAYKDLKDSVDLVVGITHQDLKDDLKLMQFIPGTSLLVGGHDHNNMIYKFGSSILTKADANVKTIYRHDFVINTRLKNWTLNSILVPINSSIPEDPATKTVVDKWSKLINKNFLEQGFNLDSLVTKLESPLDGKEQTVRSGPCAIGKMLAESFQYGVKETSDFGIVNSGSIRIDDVLTGVMTEYDALRALPFGGSIIGFEIRGDSLISLLNKANTLKNTGGFLQYSNISRDENLAWKIQGSPISNEKWYKGVTSDFLIKGLEKELSGFTDKNPGVRNVAYPDPFDTNDIRNDLRKAFIRYLRSRS